MGRFSMSEVRSSGQSDESHIWAGFTTSVGRFVGESHVNMCRSYFTPKINRQKEEIRTKKNRTILIFAHIFKTIMS